MEAHTFLIHLVLILVSARICGELASYFKAPAVMGELIAGIIIGPSFLGLIELSEPIHLLAQVGIILLLFEVGLETEIERLTSAGGQSFMVACGGVLFPLISGFCLSYYVFNFSLLASLFMGSTLTATSIGITLRVLQELKKQKSHESQIIIGSAVIDDIIGIILLSMLYEFSASGGINLWNTSKVIVLIALFFLISPFAAKGIAYIIKKWEEKSEIPGLLPTTIISSILLFSWIAYELGAPELLGGFAAGLALSRQFFFPFAAFLHQSQEFNHRVEKQMTPIIHLFTPIFFVSIGLSLNLRAVEWGSLFIWSLIASLLLVGIIGKVLSGFLLRKESLMTKILIGVAMVPRGEVGLIFANVALTSQVIEKDVYAALIVVISLTTLMAPFALRYLYSRSSEELQNQESEVL